MKNVQNYIVAGSVLGAGYFCWHTKKDLAISIPIIIGATFVGFIVGGFADTVINPVKTA